MMKFFLVALFMICSLYDAHAEAKPLTPAEAAAAIDAKGAHAFVQSLPQGDFDKIMDHVSAGDAAWIALLPKIAPGTDAGFAEIISVSLADALLKNAGAVLSILTDNHDDETFGVDFDCSAPFNEPTRKELSDYKNKAIPAVEKARAASPARADRCLIALRAIDPTSKP